MSKRTEYKNLKEVKVACRRIKTYWTDAGEFSYKCLPLIIEQLTEINQSLKKLALKKRKPSAYNEFIGWQLSEGKSLKEAIEAWREDKKSLKKLEKIGQALYSEKHSK